MNEELFAELAVQAQAGEWEAMEQLLLLSYTPVVYQCRKILQNDPAARKLTKEILSTICTQLDSLAHPEAYESWMCKITAARCVQVLRQQEIEIADLIPPENVKIPRKNLDEGQTAQLVQQIVDHLPDETRLCLLLYCCGSIDVGGIARLTSFSGEDVQEHLRRAQSIVNVQLKKYHRMGVRFAAITSLPELLRTAMYQNQDTQAAAALADEILRENAPPAVPVKKHVPLVKLLVIGVLTVAIVILLMIAWLVIGELKRVLGAA